MPVDPQTQEVEERKRMFHRIAYLEAENAALHKRLAAAETDLALRLEYDKTLEQLANKYAQERHDAETRLAAAADAQIENQTRLAALLRENVELQQREQQAQAIIQAFTVDYEAWKTSDPDDNSPYPPYIDQARAWLANRAEQRAAAQEGIQ